MSPESDHSSEAVQITPSIIAMVGTIAKVAGIAIISRPRDRSLLEPGPPRRGSSNRLILVFVQFATAARQSFLRLSAAAAYSSGPPLPRRAKQRTFT
jgi:hypothetical protein